MSSKSLQIQNFHILPLSQAIAIPQIAKAETTVFFHVSFLLLRDGRELTGHWRNCTCGVLQSFSRLMNLTLHLFLLLKPLLILSPSSDPFFHCCCVFSGKIRALYSAEDADAAQI